MKKTILPIIGLLLTSNLFAQIVSPTSGLPAQSMKLQRSAIDDESELPYDASLSPFYHGVASGDPMSDRVVIWTRVTPESGKENLEVAWFIASDSQFENIVNQGTVQTDAEVDYTVKVDVTGLMPATTYYYIFSYEGSNSTTGRTRTAPSSNVDQLRFGVVSCSNYQAGYYNAYARLSERKDLDAILHLGDYIYEYGAGEGTYGFDESRADRSNIPSEEIIELVDYRTRYSLYRLDPDLRAAHQQHPFIPIWDDHEFTNDAYVDGAENHNEGEGDWEERKSISKKVWFEWMPVRESTDGSIYRNIHYGDLADLIMIDTRIEGRDEQPTSALDTVDFKSLLGEEQKAWMMDELKNSEAKWKILGNQVIFSQFNVGFAATDLEGNPAPTNYDAIIATESVFSDIWDGYPKERNQIIDSIVEGNMDNIVILTGDFHSSFAFDVTKTPVVYPNTLFNNLPTPSDSYDPLTGSGSIAVEFAVPSITSANFDENVGVELSTQFEFSINNSLEALGGVNYNPHMKYADLDQHGYFVLDIKADSVQADWFFVDILDKENETETNGQSWYTRDGENHLNFSSSLSVEKSEQPDLAPATLFDGELMDEVLSSIEETSGQKEFEVFSVYPNPVNGSQVVLMNMAFLKPERLEIEVSDINGRSLWVLPSKEYQSGNYTLSIDLPDLSPGVYLLNFKTSSGKITRKLIIE